MPSAFDDSLEWGVLVYSVYDEAGPKLEETEMIYSVMVNKRKVWAAEFCKAGGKAGCPWPLAVCILKM